MKRSNISVSSKAEALLTRELKLEFDSGDHLDLTVSVASFQLKHPAFVAKAEDFETDDEAHEALAVFLSHVIRAWDEVLDDDDTPLEPTVDTLLTFGDEELAAIYLSIATELGEQAPKAERRAPADRKPSSKSSKR